MTRFLFYFVAVIVTVRCDKCLFMGHSFFSPIVRRLPYLLPSAIDHQQTVYFRGGRQGLPSSLWNTVVDRNNIQAELDTKTYDWLGMSVDGISQSENINEAILNSTEYYEKWINYAISKNPKTKFLIGLAWRDFPTLSASLFDLRSIIPLWSEVEEKLQNKYPQTKIVTVPYGLGVTELMILFDANRLPGISSMIGPASTSLFVDLKGHAGDITRDISALFFANRIYDLDSTSLSVTLDYDVDLKSVAQSVLDAYDAENLCGITSCYMKRYLSVVREFNAKEIRQWYQQKGCCNNPNCTLAVIESNGKLELT